MLLALPVVPAAGQDNARTRRHLESLQYRAFKTFGVDIDELQRLHRRSPTEWVPYCMGQRQRLAFSRATADEPLSTSEAECKALLDQVPTRFEDPSDYEILRRSFDAIHSAASSIGLAIPYRPLLGTVAGGDLNASVDEAGGYVLAVDGGAWKMSWSLAKILAWSLPTLGNDSSRGPFDTDWAEVRRHLDTHPEPSRRFRELLDATVTWKHPYFAPQHLMDREREKTALEFVETLNLAVELFLVGHEYAHLADGHLDGTIRREPAVAFPRDPIRLGRRTLAANLRFTREFDADQLGLRLAFKALQVRHANTEAAIIGAVLCIRALEILDKARVFGPGKVRSAGLGGLASCETQEALSRSHPPSSCRVWLLKQHARNEPAVLFKIELMERILEHLCSESAAGT